MRQVSVIILAYGDEPLLASSVKAVLDSRDVDVEVILVDNGASTITDVVADPRVHLLSPGENTGFAGGCNLAVAHATREVLVFVNSDLIVRDDAISFLVAGLESLDVGLA